jgi:hypothetical protein
MIGKLATALIQASFSSTLMLSRFLPGSARLASLVDTNNGDGHRAGSGVANGTGYCIGETIGG